MKLTVKKIARKNIFCDDFLNLTKNNTLDFSEKHITVIYAPNGTGKTSLAMVFDKEDGTEYSVEIDKKPYTEKDEKFVHLIPDQNGRNVIKGNTEDFILGDNIKREYELKDKLNKGFDHLFGVLINDIKNIFGISTKNSIFNNFIENSYIKIAISDLANFRQKGRNLEWGKFLREINNIEMPKVPEFEDENFLFFVNDLKSKNSIIKNIYDLQFDLIKKEPFMMKVEETDDAIRILKKYDYLNECIVCDTNIDREYQLQKKENQNKDVIASLSEQSKKIIEKIIKRIGENDPDPFHIKNSLKTMLIEGNGFELEEILKIFKDYEKIYDTKIEILFIQSVQESGLIELYDEYSKIIQEKPKFEDEDIIFIENFLNECLDRKIHLERDKKNNIRLLLGEDEFLNCDRKDLQLSNGEQNFLSITFELLKAKKLENDFIILDDPISSFDSIYKNKTAYAIIKFICNKNVLILTHSTDLIKLLEHQHRNCFSLYFLNNTIDEENGFIPINVKEIKLLLYTHEFLSLLRGEISQEILDEKSYAISLIPFMRGYCQLINNNEIKNKLTKIMHGYEDEKINLTEVYNHLFSNNVIKSVLKVSAQDIINSDIDHIKIIKNDTYPLLSKTLIHTYSYLYLRLMVEKKLVEKYSIQTNRHQMLSEIILEAFKNDEMEDKKNRIFFLSKKTLLNEFNHFEIDMNIFQPAIDITNRALNKEKDDILSKLETLIL